MRPPRPAFAPVPDLGDRTVLTCILPRVGHMVRLHFCHGELVPAIYLLHAVKRGIEGRSLPRQLCVKQAIESPGHIAY
jgi:hypothetical protein